MENIKIIDRIGKGVYGSVYSAYDRKLKSMVAVKIIPHLPDGDGQASSYREISCSNAIPEHVNIASVKYSFQATVNNQPASVLIFDLMKQDLQSYMDNARPLSRETIKHLMRQFVRGIAHCHQSRIMHRDLKPVNLLLDDKMHLKVADFGLGYPIVGNRSLPNNVAPRCYRAPELLLGSRGYSGQIDVWAVGCIFAELVTLRTIFPASNDLNELLQIFSLRGTPTEQTWPGVSLLPVYNYNTFPSFRPKPFKRDLHRIGAAGMDLLDKMLTVCPTKRITAVQALNHPYFKH